jgi:hypothetical protein
VPPTAPSAHIAAAGVLGALCPPTAEALDPVASAGLPAMVAELGHRQVSIIAANTPAQPRRKGRDQHDSHCIHYGRRQCRYGGHFCHLGSARPENAWASAADPHTVARMAGSRRLLISRVSQPCQYLVARSKVGSARRKATSSRPRTSGSARGRARLDRHPLHAVRRYMPTSRDFRVRDKSFSGIPLASDVKATGTPSMYEP